MAPSFHPDPTDRSSAPRICGRARDAAAAGLHHVQVSSLGKTGTSAPPVATRVARQGWRDPRLWIGLLIVAGGGGFGGRGVAAAGERRAGGGGGGERGGGGPP